jgi:hypothetical protein
MLAIPVSCSREEESNPVAPTIEEPNPGQFSVNAVGPAWENNIVSEAFYALSRSRSGGSSKAYNGCAMSDWPYPHQGDCCNALAKVKSYFGAWPGELGLWKGYYQQGGVCKFFVDLVAYRSSYGYPGGHLFLPTGYSWNPSHSVREARAGWIIQANGSYGPHTAIVVAVFSDGLDVVDCNWIGSSGGVYSYAIARHKLAWSTLDAWGFRAYRVHEVCRLVA